MPATPSLRQRSLRWRVWASAPQVVAGGRSQWDFRSPPQSGPMTCWPKTKRYQAPSPWVPAAPSTFLWGPAPGIFGPRFPLRASWADTRWLSPSCRAVKWRGRRRRPLPESPPAPACLPPPWWPAAAGPRNQVLAVLAATAAYAARCAPAQVRAARNPVAKNALEATKAGIRAMIPLQAALTLRQGNLAAAGVLASVDVLGKVLRSRPRSSRISES